MTRNNYSNTNANAKIYYTDGTSTTISGQSGITGEYTFVTTSTEGKSVKSFGFSWVSGTVVAYYDECGIFEGVLTAEDFESYLGEVYNIPFVDDQGDPITAYGGKINATTGVLTIDKKYLLLNTAGTFYQSGYAAYMDITDAFINNEYGEAITNRYKFGTWSEATASGINGTFTLYKNTAWSNGRLAFSLDGQTIADFRASLSTNPIEVVYKLATPIEIQLTPTQINNLLGLNQLYTDTNGDITVTFSSDGVIRTETGDIVAFDCGAEDMTKGILLNRLITGDYDKIRLSKGDNTIVLSGGAQQFVIDKYSRWL